MEKDSWAFGPVKKPRAKRHVRFRRKGAVVGLVAGLAMFSSVAMAAWTAQSVNNHASGKYGTLAAVTGVTFTPSAAGDLLPGSTGKLYIKAVNSNAQAVTLVSIDASGATFSGPGACTGTATGASLVNFDSGSSYTNGGAGYTIPAGTTSDILVKANAVSIASNADNSCQGVTLDVGGLTFNTST